MRSDPRVFAAVVAAFLGLHFATGGLHAEPPTESFPVVALEEAGETTANASVGDVDGDGHPDIVLAKGRHWPLVELVLINDGHGGFERRHDLGATSDRTYTAALVDLDGDGDLDLVVGNDRPDPSVTYLNDGDGAFGSPRPFGDPSWSTRNVTVADLDGDRLPDVVVANRGGPENLSANQVCLNDGRGGLASCRELSRDSATTIAAADMNGDGAIDLVVPHRDGGQSFVHLGDGHGGFPRRVPFGPDTSGTRAVALGDLDGDDRPDIVVGDESRGGTYVFFNRQSGFGESVPIGDANDIPYSIAVADMDRDGDADVVLGNRETAGAVLLNDGTGRAYTIARFGDGAGAVYGLAIADLDADGTLDIVAARSGAASMVYFNPVGEPVDR